MTGKCTGGVNLLDIAGGSREQQREAVRHNWCEIWHDPGPRRQFRHRMGVWAYIIRTNSGAGWMPTDVIVDDKYEPIERIQFIKVVGYVFIDFPEFFNRHFYFSMVY